MDVGDIITLLLIVGGVIVGLMKKSMDQGSPPPPKPVPGKVPDVIKEVFPNLENWMDEEEEAMKEPEYQQSTEPKVMPVAVSSEVIPSAPAFSYDTMNANDWSGVAKNPRVKSNHLQEEEPIYMEEIDFRKAIIYSEILKRPEY